MRLLAAEGLAFLAMCLASLARADEPPPAEPAAPPAPPPPPGGGAGDGSGGLAIALHAQASPKSGVIVGSVMTTAGLCAAFNARPDVRVARSFYPSGLRRALVLYLFDRYF